MHVLVVDDNRGVREALQLLFVLHGIEVRLAATPREALRIVREGQTGVVVQDMNFAEAATTGEEGRRLFHAIRGRDPDMPVILMTAWTDLEQAVALVRDGADDYLQKPWDDRSLVGKVGRLLAARRVRAERLPQADLAGLIYASPEMHAVVKLALRVAAADVPVLVTGPSGAGKERIASLLRANSPRRSQPFVVVNAGALPVELIEAELFGAVAGAYTGATSTRRGRFEEAHGGTLFLDEIGNLPLDGQAALLRVLQSGEVHRVGSGQTRHVDVRIVAATNIDLRQAIAEGRFREDLYYRLAVIEIAIPALVDRPDDIDALADHFLREAGLEPGILDGAARRSLREHGWPGNVRELQNAIQRAVLVREGHRIGVADLGLSTSPLRTTDEAARIRAALRDAEGVVSKAAHALGLSRQALYRRMERLGIRVQRTIRS